MLDAQQALVIVPSQRVFGAGRTISLAGRRAVEGQSIAQSVLCDWRILSGPAVWADGSTAENRYSMAQVKIKSTGTGEIVVGANESDIANPESVSLSVFAAAITEPQKLWWSNGPEPYNTNYPARGILTLNGVSTGNFQWSSLDGKLRFEKWNPPGLMIGGYCSYEKILCTTDAKVDSRPSGRAVLVQRWKNQELGCAFTLMVQRFVIG